MRLAACLLAVGPALAALAVAPRPAVAAPAATAAPAAFQFADDPPGDPSSTPLPKDKPWVPGWCRWDWRAGWVGQHNALVERTKKGGIDTVFFGDSITQGWGSEAKDLFESRFAGPFKAVNYGIGGDSTRQILWRVKHGAVDGLDPRLVVLMIGTNNLYDDANAGSDEEIAKGVATCVQALRHTLPKSRLLLLAILPRQNDWFCGRVRAINAIAATLDDGKDVRFLDAGAAFLEAPGKVKAELYNADQLHLSRKGYETLAGAIEPVMKEMTK
jgi:beta-glucosidase